MSILRNVSFSAEQLDAFSNHRVAPPAFVADGQLTYDLQPLIYEQLITGDGVITHSSTNRCAELSIDTATGSGNRAIMQSYHHHRYQAGRAQEVFITFNLDPDATGGRANLRKFVEYGEGTNGVGLELNQTTLNFFMKSGTDEGNETIPKASWSLDTLDGSGDANNPSGINLDITKVQILVIDIQALYVGRVRIGFDIDGMIIWCHEFMHANIDTAPYIQTANLPIRAGLDTIGTTVTLDKMYFICSCVLSRGGQSEIAGYDFSYGADAVAVSASPTYNHLFSIQPLTQFNSKTNRIQIIPLSVDISNTGASAIKWELCLGQVIGGSPATGSVNATYSAAQYVTGGTIGTDPAIIFDSGYLPASAQVKTAASRKIEARYPITLNAAGTLRSDNLGRLTLRVTGIGGTSTVSASMSWKELR